MIGSLPGFENPKSPGDLTASGANGSSCEKRWDARQIAGDWPSHTQRANTDPTVEGDAARHRQRRVQCGSAPRQGRAAPTVHGAPRLGSAHRNPGRHTGSHIGVRQTLARIPRARHAPTSRRPGPVPHPSPGALRFFPGPPRHCGGQPPIF